MNLLLLEPDELDAQNCCTLRGRRASHVRNVLRAAPGTSLRAGVLHQGFGVAEVTARNGDNVSIRYQASDAPPPPCPQDVLLLAYPRPVVLGRIAETAAALGFGHLALFRTWRVDKSHLASGATQPDELAMRFRIGMEQGRRVHPPKATFHPLFKPFVEDELPQLVAGLSAFVGHPDPPAVDTATLAAEPIAPEAPPLAMAVGPERGFTDYEIEALTHTGFRAVRCSDAPLRTEAACAALFAQLDLLRRRGQTRDSKL